MHSIVQVAGCWLLLTSSQPLSGQGCWAYRMLCHGWVSCCCQLAATWMHIHKHSSKQVQHSWVLGYVPSAGPTAITANQHQQAGSSTLGSSSSSTFGNSSRQQQPAAVCLQHEALPSHMAAARWVALRSVLAVLPPVLPICFRCLQVGLAASRACWSSLPSLSGPACCSRSVMKLRG